MMYNDDMLTTLAVTSHSGHNVRVIMLLRIKSTNDDSYCHDLTHYDLH